MIVPTTWRVARAALAAAVLAGCISLMWFGNGETFTLVSDVALTSSFETVERGDGGVWGAYPKGAYMFAEAPGFATFYSTLTGGSVAPDVNFAQHRVVAVVDADRPTAGYDVEVVAIKPRAGDLYEVTARFTAPDGPAAAVLTKPYHIVKVMVIIEIPAPGPG